MRCPTCNRPFASSRSTDPSTSQEAGESVDQREGPTLTVERGTHRFLLLVSYFRGPDSGLTDRQAAWIAGISYPGICWWKRCSELRQGGFIEPTGETWVDTTTGRPVRLCRITDAGRARIMELGSPV